MPATMKSWITRAALAGSMLAGGAGAGAALAASPPAAPGSATGAEQAEIAGVQTAGVTPSAAIAAAEGRARGHAVSFGYESDATTNAYEVTVATASGLQLVRVNPSDGSIAGVMPQPANAVAGDGLPAGAVSQAAAAPTSLASAIATAEKQGGGRALEANYMLQNGQLGVAVDVAGNGATRSFTVDPATGRATQVTTAASDGQQQVQEGQQESDGQQVQEGRQERHGQSSDRGSDGESGQEAD